MHPLKDVTVVKGTAHIFAWQQKHKGMSPAKLLFGRKIISKAPHVDMGAASHITEFLSWDRQRKQMGKSYAGKLPSLPTAMSEVW